MRIIAGKLKQKPIFIQNSIKIRPTQAKVRAAIFNIIQSGKGFTNGNNILDGAIVLDLCCGTGSLGFEALSRGAKYCYFIDHNPAVLACVAKNAANLKQVDNTYLICSNALSLPIADQACDLVFIDPPYKILDINSILHNLKKKAWLKSKAIIIIENCRTNDLTLDQEEFTLINTRSYGKTQIMVIEN